MFTGLSIVRNSVISSFKAVKTVQIMYMCKDTFPLLVYLTNAPTIVRCTVQAAY